MPRYRVRGTVEIEYDVVRVEHESEIVDALVKADNESDALRKVLDEVEESFIDPDIEDYDTIVASVRHIDIKEIPQEECDALDREDEARDTYKSMVAARMPTLFEEVQG